jgi:hypothetical protein
MTQIPTDHSAKSSKDANRIDSRLGSSCPVVFNLSLGNVASFG